MWFNINTRVHQKAQKRQNIAVGPEDPLGNYQDPKPWVTKGSKDYQDTILFLDLMVMMLEG